MSLNKFTDAQEGKDLKFQIGCDTLDCTTLIATSMSSSSITANTVITDTINEKTPANGVSIDGLMVKDGSIYSGTYMSSTSLIKSRKASNDINLLSTYVDASAIGIGAFFSGTSGGLYFSRCDTNGNFGGVNLLNIQHSGDIILTQAGKAFSSDVIKTDTIQGKSATALTIGATTNNSVSIGASGIDTKINGNLVWAVPHSQIYGGELKASLTPNVPMTTATAMNNIDTDYKISLAGIVSTDAVDFTNSSDGKITYTGTKTRMFHTAWTISAIDTKSANVSFAIFKNGVAIQGSAVEIDLGSTTNSTAIHIMMTLATGNYLEIYGRTSVAANSVVIRYMNGFAMAMTS